MSFVQFSGINLSFTDRDILKDVSLRLSEGSRSCLTGANGSGKSTLMKIIAGKISADSGSRSVQKETRISYLPQSGIVHQEKSLRDEVETAFSYVHALLEKLDEKGALLENTQNDDSSTKTLIEEHHNLQEQIEKTGYYRRESAITSVLTGLGFSVKDLSRDTGEFSGGWQMRIALAKILLEKPDILLLDEPTNYLDIEARSWLEKWLEDFKGGYLLVSHDRYFLDMSVNEVYELYNGNLKRFAGNYSAYEKVRKAEFEGIIKRYNEQQEEITKTQALIRRFRYKASKAAFAQELIKRLEKMELIEIPESFKKININFPPSPHCGSIALTLENISKTYNENDASAARHVLKSLDLCLESGERLAVAGPNGAGKSTLLRIIAGIDKKFEGSVKYGSGISIGYFSQDAAEAMDSQETILEMMEELSPHALIPKLRDMLGAFLFRGDDVYKSVRVLSGGEKSRLALLRMFLKPANLLILDEPTNHLDLHSKDILLDALKKYTGTIIFVSHDRLFMEELSGKTLELSVKDGNAGNAANAKLYYGNYAYYLERISKEESGETNDESKNKNNKPNLNNTEIRAIDKQKQAQLRKLEKQETEILKTLEELEKKKTFLEVELTLPDVYSNGEKTREVKKKLYACAAEIESKTREWEMLMR